MAKLARQIASWWLAATMVGAIGVARPVMADHGTHPVIDLTFPVAGSVSYGDGWHASRGSRGQHQAQDLVGRKLQRVHAAVGGIVCDFAEHERTLGGYELAVCGDDGRRYVYSHLNDDTPGTDDGDGGQAWAYAPQVRPGARVGRRQWLGWMGDSGNAEREGAQLHFHIQTTLTDPAEAEQRPPRLDPLPSLVAAQERGDTPPVVAPAAAARVSGSSRFETAVAISRQRSTSHTVLVAPAGTPQEALVAAPLAGRFDAPVLLAEPQGLSGEVSAEVRRLQARQAVLIGRADQLGAGVEADLRAAGILLVRRVQAPDLAALSVTVAREVAPLGPARMLLARGLSSHRARVWPDALSASALAAHLRLPVLLTSAEQLPPVVRDYLAESRPARLEVVGGPEAVSDAVVAQARQASGAAVTRLAGATRYGTSVVVAEAARREGLDARRVWLATGRNFPDALAAGPGAARQNGVVVLLDGQRPGGARETSRWLADRAPSIDALLAVGGKQAIRDLVLRHAAELAAG